MDLTKKLFGIPVWILVSIAISGLALAAWAAFTSWTSHPTGFAIKSLPDVVIKEIEGFDIATIIIDGETSRTKDAIFSITPRGCHTEPFIFSWDTNFDLGYCDCKDIYNKTICEETTGCNWIVPNCNPEVGPDNKTGCRGTPETDACSVYTEEQCRIITGCTLGGECTGTPSDPCPGYADINSCTSDPSCEWVVDVCVGSPDPCSTYTDKTSCDGAGCKWNAECSGTPTNCIQLTELFTEQGEVKCDETPGCSMKDYKVQLFYCQDKTSDCTSFIDNPIPSGTPITLEGDGSYYYNLRTTIQPRSCPGILNSIVTVSSS